MPRSMSTTPMIMSARFMGQTLARQNLTQSRAVHLPVLRRHTPTPRGCGEWFERQGRYYERLVAAAAATFLAALAAFAAVDPLRRPLVFGSVAGASPLISAPIKLVTDNFGPSPSKSTQI